MRNNRTKDKHSVSSEVQPYTPKHVTWFIPKKGGNVD